MVRVTLLVYDLSKGMAAQLSEAIIKQRIDGIWHTGVSVFGMEYFFGGGIQKLPLGMFSRNNGMDPVSEIDMGDTRKSLGELEEFLRGIHHQFNANTYDLLHNNCNNFSDTVMRFLLAKGIPSYIIDLPRVALSNPILRSMLESMQNSVRNSQGLDPFGGTGTSNGVVGVGGSAVPAVTSSLSPAPFLSSHNVPPIQSKEPPKAPLEERPILSADSDSKLLQAMSKKLMAASIDGNSVLSDSMKEALTRAIDSTASGNPIAPDDYIAFHALLTLLQRCPETQVPAFFCLRLMALHYQNLSSPDLRAILGHIVQSVLLASPAAAVNGGFVSLSAVALGFSVLVNSLATVRGEYLLLGEEAPECLSAADVVDAGMRGLAHGRAEVRLMAGSFVYNICLSLSKRAAAASGDEIQPHFVQIMCGVLELLAAEDSEKVRLRELNIVCLILRSSGSPASLLLAELGFAEGLEAMHRSGKLTHSELAPLEEILYTVHKLM